MQILFNPVFLNHMTDGMHPESVKRLEAFGELPVTHIPTGLEALDLVHDPSYISKVESYCQEEKRLDPDTMTSVGSFEAAIHAVGATVLASEQNDFALVRPPGHHSYRDRGSGFCLFNNIAVAAKHWNQKGKKVLIIDFDGHFGDGTYAIFKDVKDTFYWSIHQYPAFPHQGTSSDIGAGPGTGYSICNPVPPRSGDDIFLDAFYSFLPIVRQFNPDIVGVSAGFDAHMQDLLLDLNVTLSTFYKIGFELSKQFENIFAVLEGGYNVAVLPKCVENFIAGVNQEKMPHQETTTLSKIQDWNTYDLNKHVTFNHLSASWDINARL